MRAIKKVKPLRGAGDPRHGTATAYGYHGCRCTKCRQWSLDYSHEYRATREVYRHDRSGYELGCRCDDCKAGKSEAMRREKQIRDAYRAEHAPDAPVIKADFGSLA